MLPVSFHSYRPGLTIGLLGGSFNPAHEGHLAISLEAKKRLKLHQVWWVVAAQNPLKSTTGMASFEKRAAFARVFAAANPWLRIIEVEEKRGLRYTYHTVSLLQTMAPGLRFVWLMGRDNLTSFPRWHRWRDLARLIPIAVIDRGPGRPYAALRSRAGRVLAGCGMAFLRFRLHPQSSTALRKGKAA